MHRTRNVNHRDTRFLTTIVIILQIIPILLKHSYISIRGTLPSLKDTLCDIYGVQDLSINLGSSILSKSFILLLNDITTSKSVLINQTGARRNLIKLNLVPTIFRHQLFNDVDAGPQNGKGLAVLLGGHAESLTSQLTIMTSFIRACILGLQPLCQQRGGLTLDIQHKLLLHKSKHFLFQRSADEHIQVIPTTILRNVLHIAGHSFGMVASKVLDNNAEESALTLTATHIAQIEQTLQCIFRILYKCLLEHQQNITVRALTHRTTHSEHIKQSTFSGLMGNCAILGVGVVRSSLHRIQIAIHSFQSPFSLGL